MRFSSSGILSTMWLILNIQWATVEMVKFHFGDNMAEIEFGLWFLLGAQGRKLERLSHTSSFWFVINWERKVTQKLTLGFSAWEFQSLVGSQWECFLERLLAEGSKLGVYMLVHSQVLHFQSRFTFKCDFFLDRSWLVVLGWKHI